MKCPVCSSEIPESSRFCPECGAAAPVTVPPYEPPKEEAPPEKKRSYKLILTLAAIGAAVVIGAIAAALLLAGNGGKKAASDAWSPDALVYYNDCVFSRSGRVCEIEEGFVVGQSLDGSIMLVYAYNDEELFIVTKAGSNRISRRELLSAVLSADGSKAVWIEEDGKLFSCDVKSGKTTLLAEVDEDKYPSAVVSPDGKTVLCSDGGELYLRSSGKPTELGESGVPVGVANGGKYV
ncbi:MAG: zinc ribbon domain-containing protein, partial [Oscillospiraceae bacterium]|nr:zinc ribbon domain-containing protein [Oscillospiraceae bacterium]